jgi:hypothetical protein
MYPTMDDQIDEKVLFFKMSGVSSKRGKFSNKILNRTTKNRMNELQIIKE